MSVVSMRKATLLCADSSRNEALARLQELGCLHLIPFRPPAEATEAPAGLDAYRAYRYLIACRERRRQVTDPRLFDRAAVERELLALQERERDLGDEHDFLAKRVEALEPWGDFQYPDEEGIGGQRLWFYIVPLYRLRLLQDRDLIWQIVRRDSRFAYVVVLAAEEPEGMPAPRTHTGSVALSTLRRRLEAIEVDLEDLQARRVSLTKWRHLFARALAEAESQAALVAAHGAAMTTEGLFALQGWIPADRVADLEAFAREHGHALLIEEPLPAEEPPTLLRNPEPVDAGATLVQFYATPGYRAWDPSVAVLVSFAIFFAMILGDAGYAAILGIALAFSWRSLATSATRRRVRNIFTAVVGCSFAYGVAAGNYFGITPPPGSFLGALRLFDGLDQDAMLRVSLWVGTVHIFAANLRTAWHLRGSARAFAALGWCAILVGAAGLWLAYDFGGPWMERRPVAIGVLALGGAGIVLFSSRRTLSWRRLRDWGYRLLDGTLALTGLSNAFGDVMSYMRLFALGLATTAMATTFNDLAMNVRQALPGIGILVAALVLAFGHGLNLLLGVMSGVVHGLRLNFLEFFRWGMDEEGYPFHPFEKKERPTWTS
ncbi:MAG: hypothetical protein KC466_15440 [Myxococcales bacterium]|nr:hypothetical protein [Myxococcales bacterium]